MCLWLSSLTSPTTPALLFHFCVSPMPIRTIVSRALCSPGKGEPGAGEPQHRQCPQQQCTAECQGQGPSAFPDKEENERGPDSVSEVQSEEMGLATGLETSYNI